MSYLANILEQPQVLRTVTATYKESAVWEKIRAFWAELPSPRLILTGLGASFNALYPVRYYLHQAGVPALHLDTGELIHYLSEGLAQSPLLLVVVSQSGESIEIKRLLTLIEDIHPDQRPWMVSITNEPGNTLAQYSHVALFTRAGAEVGVATKTYTSTLAVLHWLGRALTHIPQPEDYLQVLQAAQACEHLLQDWEALLDPAVAAVQEASTFALVARGASIASACNGALVIQEALRKMAAGFVGSQFRHGPMEMLSPDLATLLFVSPKLTYDISSQMARDIHARGGCMVTIGAAVPDLPSPHLALPPLDPWISPILEMVVVQLLVEKLAKNAGLVPGQFRWAGKVIQQE